MSKHTILRRGKKIGTAIIGGLVVLIGLLLIPYPGPGWLIVFAGFAILATEFVFAAKTLEWLKRKFEERTQWLKKQPFIVQLLLLAFTGLVVLATVWLINGFGLMARLLSLDLPLLVSPFFR